MTWPGRAVSAPDCEVGESEVSLPHPRSGHLLGTPASSSWQGNILLAAESEFEQTQWLEMLQESGKV